MLSIKSILCRSYFHHIRKAQPPHIINYNQRHQPAASITFQTLTLPTTHTQTTTKMTNRLFRFTPPAWLNSPNTRTAGVYISGGLFSIGFFALLNAAVYSNSAYTGTDHVTFVDWIPAICSALGMLVINSIEKSRLSADSYSYSGTGVAWKARVVLFMGFALMAGGLAGSVVSSLFCALMLGGYVCADVVATRLSLF